MSDKSKTTAEERRIRAEYHRIMADQIRRAPQYDPTRKEKDARAWEHEAWEIEHGFA